jgi:outer membrane lipoprotein-sorting protein
MAKFSRKGVAGLGAMLGLGTVFVAGSAQADPNCDAILNAMTKHYDVPYALSLSMNTPFGPRTSRSIHIGNKLYLNLQGHWQVVGFDPKQEAATVRERAAGMKQTCARKPDEKMNGETAAVYVARMDNKGAISENTVWVSKATGLPLKTQISFHGNSMVSTLDYKNVKPPLGVK